MPEAGGGIIWDMGCYATNMARGMLGQEPTEVFGFGEVRAGQPTETSVSGAMRFPAGRAAPFTVSFDYQNPFSQVEVVGTEGWLALPGTGFRREPYTKLLLHQGETYAADASPRWRCSPLTTLTPGRSSTWPGPYGASTLSPSASTTPGPIRRPSRRCTNR